MGLFTFSDVTLKGYNYNSYFNDETDFRSIFRVSRDLCKVRIEFEDIEVDRDSSSRVTGTSPRIQLFFNGIINEEATRVDAVSDQITFKALSRESGISNHEGAGGRCLRWHDHQAKPSSRF